MAAYGQFRQFNMRFTRIPPWKMVLIGAGVLAITVALAFVAFTAFLIVFPIAVISGAAYRLFGRKTSGLAPTPPARGNPDIIEGEYVVIEPERDHRP